MKRRDLLKLAPVVAVAAAVPITIKSEPVVRAKQESLFPFIRNGIAFDVAPADNARYFYMHGSKNGTRHALAVNMTELSQHPKFVTETNRTIEKCVKIITQHFNNKTILKDYYKDKYFA